MRSLSHIYHDTVMKVLATLQSREKDIIVLRYGLNGEEPETLEEIGKKYHVTRERIRQIEAKAIRKLRHPSRSNILREDDYESFLYTVKCRRELTKRCTSGTFR